MTKTPTSTLGISPRADRVVLALLCLTLAFLLFLILTFGHGRDQGIYTVVARTILEGGMPYRDAWDFKPPGIYLVFALSRALFGPTEHGIRILEAAGLAATAWGLIHLSQRWWGQWRIGLVAAVLAALVHAQLDFWHSGQPETFGGMLTVAGVVVGTRQSRNRWLQYLACGLLFGAAGLLKPPLAGGGAVLAFWAAWRSLDSKGDDTVAARFRKGWRRALQPILWVLVGGLIPFAACLAWFAAKGALTALYETLFVFTPHYTSLAWKDRTFLGMLYQACTQWLVSFCSVVTVGVVLALASWRKVWAHDNIGLVLGIVAMQLLGVALQGKFFPYHYAACWPLTGLLAALGWWHLWRAAIARSRGAIAAAAMLTALSFPLRTATKDLSDSFWQRSYKRTQLFLLGAGDQEGIDALASVADVNAKGNRDVAAELRKRVGADGYVYIWGFEPIIYDLADRRLASHFLYNVPQRVEWAADASRAKLMAHLREHPPEAIVVAHHDVFPMVTGNAIDSADVLDKEFAELKAFIDTGYGKLKRVQDFDLYLRK